MFPRQKRLSRKRFPIALKSSRRLSSPHFFVLISEEVRGYAVVVSKNIARLSITRHQIKRRVLAALKTLLFPLPPALILFPKSSVLKATYQDIRTELIELLSKKHL